MQEFGGQIPQMRRMPQTYRAQGSGSGVIVRPDGWILTNDHVVGGADKVTVKLHDGREFEGTVRRDFRSDLALVKINASGLVPAEFADSDQIKVGQWAVAFGSPFSLDDTMTHGIISARQRQKVISEGGETRFYPSLLQTDASINPGNSGGALVDINGRVIGINVAINSPSGGSVGIGFAIPSNTARDVTEQLIATGKVTRGFLGVAPRALNPNERQRYGVPTGGALIEQVSENTPASRAGFEVEDVVVRYNGQPVASDIAFRELVARTAPGKAVDVVVRRGGKEVTLKVTPEAQKEAAAAENEASVKAEGGKLGVQVQTITPDVAKQYNLGSLNAGVLVGGIQPGSPAADAGIQPGDVIVRANGRAVRSAEDLRGAVESLKSGDTATLVVYRNKARTLVSVRIP
jgi:serine protease Do